MEEIELFREMYVNLSNQLMVLSLVCCIMFVALIVLFFYIIPYYTRKILQLESDLQSLENYLESVRKINLKKRSDEKLVLPPMFPKDKI